jgi:hypothetical protein
MSAMKVQTATKNGKRESNPSRRNDPELEQQLEAILARVPPIIRLPPPRGRCPYTGKSRTALVELIAPCERNGFKPAIQAIYEKSHRHAQRGTWSIPSATLFRYLLSLTGDSAQRYVETTKARAAKD